MLGYHQ